MKEESKKEKKSWLVKVLPVLSLVAGGVIGYFIGEKNTKIENKKTYYKHNKYQYYKK